MGEKRLESELGGGLRRESIVENKTRGLFLFVFRKVAKCFSLAVLITRLREDS